MTRLLLLCVVLGIAAGAWLLVAPDLDHRAVRGGARDAAPAAPPTRTGAAVWPPPEPATSADVDGKPTKPTVGGGVLVLPNGERVRALNGVRTEIRLLWPAETPYSPITGITTQTDGVEWYVHVDGSHSTTQMIYRSDLGRTTAMSMVANPRPALPLQSDQDSGRKPAARRSGR